MISSILSLLIKHSWLPALVIVAGAGYAWLKSRDAKVRYDALADVRVEEVRQMANRLDSAYAKIEVKDSVIKEQAKRIAKNDSALRVTDRKVAAKTDSAIKDLATTLNTQQQVQLDKIVDGFKTQLAIRDSMMANSARLLLAAQGQVAQRDSLLRNVRLQFANLQQRYERAEAAGRPSTIDKTFSFIGKAVVVGAVVYGATQVY